MRARGRHPLLPAPREAQQLGAPHPLQAAQQAVWSLPPLLGQLEAQALPRRPEEGECHGDVRDYDRVVVLLLLRDRANSKQGHRGHQDDEDQDHGAKEGEQDGKVKPTSVTITIAPDTGRGTEEYSDQCRDGNQPLGQQSSALSWGYTSRGSGLPPKPIENHGVVI